MPLLCLLACRPQVETDEPAPVAATPEPARPTIDGDAMLAAIEWLASDERRGRHTLEPQIEEVAGWIAGQYEEMGLEPVFGAEQLRVAYELRTKVEAGEHQALAIVTGGKNEPVEVSPEDFTPRAEGASASAEGEVVFVGYGAHWTREKSPAQDRTIEGEGEGEDPGKGASSDAAVLIDSYDDLAGVELDGKIALVLAQAPNTPDLRALFAAMQGIALEFEERAAPLREAKDLAKLEKAHHKAREQVVELVSPFVDTRDLGDAFWKVEDPLANFDIMAIAGALASRVADRPQFDPREITLSRKVQRLAEAGAVGVIVVEGPRSVVGTEARTADELPGVSGSGSSGGGHGRIVPNAASIPVVQLKWKVADRLFRIDGKKLSKVQAAIDGDYQPRSRPLGVEAQIQTELAEERLEVPNVLAALPGTSDEIVLLGAHFDHIGNEESGSCKAIVRRDERDTICNGADDNASGTAMLLELARAYTRAGLEPERTIVFAHFSGEELGLLGSRALIEDSPFDQGKVVAMVNLDMVGRLGPRGLAVGGIGSSAEWMPLLDELGNYGMKILYEGATTSRSDHAHWFRREIPVLYFFTGVHGDYHRAGDEIDEIDAEGLRTVGQMVGDLVWELASGYEIQWRDPPAGMGIGRGLPGSDPASVIKKVDTDGSRIEL